MRLLPPKPSPRAVRSSYCSRTRLGSVQARSSSTLARGHNITTTAAAAAAVPLPLPPPVFQAAAAPSAVEALVRPHRVALPVRGVERLGGHVRREVRDARAKLSAGPEPRRVPLEGGLEGVDAALLPGPEPLVQLPPHTRQELEAPVALVDLHL